MITETRKNEVMNDIEEWRNRLEKQEEHLLEREQELAKRTSEQFQKEIAQSRITVAEENASLYKGRMQAAEGYYKNVVSEIMLAIGMCPTCRGAVPQGKPCDCKVIDHV